MRIGIIGAGITGLALGHYLSKEHQVTIFEKDARIVGLASCYSHKGHEFDKYYHFIFLNDYHTVELSMELGIQPQISWGTPCMALFRDGKLYPFSTAMDLFRFPHLTWWDKLRFAIMTVLISRFTGWRSLEGEGGLAWFERMYGKNTADTLWGALMEKKFHEHSPQVNAAWSWNEIFRRSKSRKGLGKEKLGYFEGGMNTLLSPLGEHISESGGRIITKSRLKSIRKKGGKVVVTSDKGELSFDAVFSTIPTRALKDYLPKETVLRGDDINYLSVRCAVFLLKKPLSEYFWINILNKELPHAVIVEFTNLRKTYPHVVYIPFYLPFKGKYYTMPDKDFKKLNLDLLKMVNPDLRESDIIYYGSFRDPFAQAVFNRNYSEKISTYHTPLDGLFNTNHSHIYPERSGVNECIRFGKYLARDFSKGLEETYVFTSE